jgi:hypothetical protein
MLSALDQRSVLVETPVTRWLSRCAAAQERLEGGEDVPSMGPLWFLCSRAEPRLHQARRLPSAMGMPGDGLLTMSGSLRMPDTIAALERR